MRMRWIAAAVLPALLTGCQPGTQPPSTAAPQPGAQSPVAGSLALPPSDQSRRYDNAIVPLDETRIPRKATPGAAVARPDTSRAAQRERQQIEARENEEAAGPREMPILIAASAPTSRTNSLALPPGGGSLPLPKPVGEAHKPAASRPATSAAMPPAIERPERPQVAAPAKPSEVTAAPAPPPEPVQTREAAVASVSPPPSPPSSPPPVERTEPPKVAAATAVEPRLPPAGPPLATVAFEPRSAELSDGMRAALAFFVRDANAQGVRHVELWASAGVDDPALARKIALARALAVQAVLIDLGLKARVDIGGYTESHESGVDRVDLVIPRR